jgi:hypothetical protein
MTQPLNEETESIHYYKCVQQTSDLFYVLRHFDLLLMMSYMVLKRVCQASLLQRVTSTSRFELYISLSLYTHHDKIHR